MKNIMILCCAMIASAFANSSQVYEYAFARFQAAQNAVASRIQRKELEQSKKDFERFIDLYPKDARITQVLSYIAEIEKSLSQNTKKTGVAQASLVPNVQSLLAPKKMGGTVIENLITAPGTLNSIVLDKKGDDVSVKLVFSSPVKWMANQIQEDVVNKLPARIFLDLEKTSAAQSLTIPEVIENKFVKSVRLGKNTSDRTRLVLDLVQNLSSTQYQIEGSNQEILIRLSSLQAAKPLAPIVAATSSTAALPNVPPVKAKEAPIPISEAFPKMFPPKVAKKDKLRIIIDAGHGGDDTGAIGPSGTMEKTITLAIAKKLKERFSENRAYEVLMTRDSDQRLQLADRTDFANQMEGDLFVSIHANANHKSSAKGISTYFLNNADDQESLRVATRENGDLAPPVAQSKKLPDTYFLEVMKASMEKNFHTVQSTDLAHEIQSELLKNVRKKYDDIVDLGVRSAGFYVLTGAKMPAVLIETSFISNETEEKRLNNEKYQKTLVDAIYNGLISFSKMKERRSHALLSHPNSSVARN